MTSSVEGILHFVWGWSDCLLLKDSLTNPRLRIREMLMMPYTTWIVPDSMDVNWRLNLPGVIEKVSKLWILG